MRLGLSTSTRIRSVLALLCCAALAGAAGCQKDSPGERPGDEASQGASRPVVPGPGPSLGHRGSIALDTWSADAEAIIALDMAQLRHSPLGPLVDNLLRTTLPGTAGCGAAVVEQIDQLLIVSANSHESDPIYILGGVSRDGGGCAKTPSVWIDDRTLAIAPNWEQRDFDDVAAGKRGKTNPGLLSVVETVDTHAAIWFAASKPADAGSWSEEFTELRGAIALDGGLRASFRVKFPSEERAATAATTFERTMETLTPFAQYLEDARARADGVWLEGRIIMSGDQLARLPSDPMFSGLFPQPSDPQVTIVEDPAPPPRR